MSQESLFESLSHLIIVPGHAVYIGSSPTDAYDGTKWEGTYAGYKYNDEVINYFGHIQRGIMLAHRDVGSALVFSGGKTRKGVQLSEAESYRNLATQHCWFGADSVVNRTRIEEFATDSFENLLFSIQLFNLLHPHRSYPSKVTLVGLRFKRRRYEFHAETIIKNQHKGITPFIFRYDDFNDIPDYVLREGSGEGEELTLQQFRVWPFGDQGDLLKKRQIRDPHNWSARSPYK
jgi:hypothetical protein